MDYSAVNDTGAERSCMPLHACQKLALKKYSSSSPKVKMTGGQVVKSEGLVVAEVSLSSAQNQKHVHQEFIILPGLVKVILGRDFLVAYGCLTKKGLFVPFPTGYSLRFLNKHFLSCISRMMAVFISIFVSYLTVFYIINLLPTKLSSCCWIKSLFLTHSQPEWNLQKLVLNSAINTSNTQDHTESQELVTSVSGGNLTWNKVDLFNHLEIHKCFSQYKGSSRFFSEDIREFYYRQKSDVTINVGCLLISLFKSLAKTNDVILIEDDDINDAVDSSSLITSLRPV
ncbi:hypothetical protein GEMRC1_000609 [Eukaryota sp. GEM-RC1]